MTRILSNPTSQNESAIAEDDDDTNPPPRSLLFRPTTHTGTGTNGATNAHGSTTTHGHGHTTGGHFRTASLNLGVWGSGAAPGNSGTAPGGHHTVAARERAAGVMRRLSLSGALGGNSKVRQQSPWFVI